MVENIKLVIFSFISSCGFGLIFGIEKKKVPYAGLGGALTRVIYLLLLANIETRFVYTLLAAIFAALYAELMAMRFHTPSTCFLYPAIIPLVPGDLLYNMSVNIIMSDMATAYSYCTSLVLTLAGLSLGFVLVSTFTYYRRLFKLGLHVAEVIRRPKLKGKVFTPKK